MNDNINILKVNDENYNNKLKQLSKPPQLLFYKGNINLIQNKIIAIVGSRKCSPYGKKVAYNLAVELSKQRFYNY